MNQTASQDSNQVTFRSPHDALEALIELQDSLRKVVGRMRQVSAPPDGRARHISPLKAADVAEHFGISTSLLNLRVRELSERHQFPVNQAKTQRVYFPEDIRMLTSAFLERDPDRMKQRIPGTTPAQIVAVGNQKGGVGKTTTSVTLAQDAAFRGMKVLLIDLDPQASATASFLIESTVGSTRLVEGTHAELSIDSTISPVLMGTELNPRNHIRKTHWQTIDIIPSTPDLIDAEFQMIQALIAAEKNGGRAPFWTALRTALRKITVDEYDLIVIDTPPAMNLTTIAVMLAAHGLLVPIPPRNLDIESLLAFITTTNGWLEGLVATFPFELKWIRFLTTMARSESHAEARNDHLMRQRLASTFVAESVPRLEALQRASGGAPSIFEVQPDALQSAQKSANAARRTVHRIYGPIFQLVEQAYREMAKGASANV